MKPKWVCIVFALVLVNEWLYSCDGCLEQEKIALLQIKAWINYPNGNALADWVDDAVDCCNWSRVECNNTTRRVTRLSLRAAREYWKTGNRCLNTSLFLPLEELSSLDLAWNSLVSSCSDNKGFRVLSSRFRKLEVLDLSYNQCDDSILLCLSEFSFLKSLKLAYNMLTGSLHIKELSSLINLEELDLGYNRELKHFLALRDMMGLKKLKVLHLDHVQINGSILLQSLGAVPSLKTLSVTGYDFEGISIRQEFDNLTNLEDLFMDASTLPVNFFERIGTLSTLKVLSLSGSDLSGTLPLQGLCELTNLEELYLFDNKLEGPLPACFGNLSSLRALDVADNQFVGNIASSPLTNLKLLEYLSLSRNHFQVPVSFNSFMNHSNLKLISCDNNKLIAEPTVQTSVPKFQLNYFSMSNFATEQDTTFPNFLYYQSDLRDVDLSYNNFSGMFPSWLFENNTSLEQLHLGGNSFIGSLRLPHHPNPNLYAIDISINHIRGQLPRNTCLIFPGLKYLSMADNKLTGSIPPCLGNMSSLIALDLSNNQLSGGMPELLASLWVVKLSKNNLIGQIPSSVFQCPYLYLDGNKFTGQISNYSSIKSSKLFWLDISNNHLSGMLPRWISNMSTLQVINLSKNQFEGPIPTEFCKFAILEYFDLSENNLSGSIPSCFNPPRIVHVHLYKNQLSGPLTNAFSKCSSLVTLDLSDNKLTGPVPDWIGRLSKLSVVLLKANQFDGNLPVQLCSLKTLNMLDLSQNKFSGPLTSCLGNLTFRSTVKKSFLVTYSWGYLFIRGLYLTSIGRSMLAPRTSGSIHHKHPTTALSIDNFVKYRTKRISYTYKGNVLDFMAGIDLSCNSFTGEIPPEIGSLSEIRALNLSYNYLTGSIPSTFSNLKQIESLDLSFNKLSGQIPLQLTRLNSLSVFSVAYNNLSGRTPESAQFGTFDESSYEGNPFLYISPLNNRRPPPMHNDSNDSGEDEGIIDMDIFLVSFVVSYIYMVLGIATILYINPYWRRTWFCLVEVCIRTCSYFVLDSLHKLPNFRWLGKM